jgi:hypothetical protein
MATKKKSERTSPGSTQAKAKPGPGAVSEWFGHRVSPNVASTKQSLADQQEQRCPFLSAETHRPTECIKSQAARGVCTIGASSNGFRQDWIVCPFRALDAAVLQNATRRMFGLAEGPPLLMVPAPSLADPAVRMALKETVARGEKGFVYLTAKLGGEISLAPTAQSPELSFDITIVEMAAGLGGELTEARYAILEMQTMDFHGSYRKVVQNLGDALRLHKDGFHEALTSNQKWTSEDIEGPNIANVFKRTFYQMMLKFQIAGHGACAGCVMAIPQAVWDSWQRHLGAPTLGQEADGTFTLRGPGPKTGSHAWIYVFDIDSASTASPNPIVLRRVIQTDADSVAHFTLKVAPEAALAAGGAADRILQTIHLRLATHWPELTAPNAGPLP